MLTTNIIANLAGRTLTLGLILIFLPIFLHLLGHEAFGLISVSTSILLIFSLLEAGFSSTVNRITSRSNNSNESKKYLSTALRSFEIIVLLISFIVIALSPLIGWSASSYWLNNSHLSNYIVADCITMIVIAAAIRFGCLIHLGVLAGAEKQVHLNLILLAGTFLRTFGAYIAINILGADPRIYFFFIVVESLLIFGLSYNAAWQYVGSFRHARFSINILKENAGFAGWTALNTTFNSISGQLDRLIVSTMATLIVTGYYGIASTLASAIVSLGYPLAVAALPRFTSLNFSENHQQAAKLFFNLQLIIIIIISPICATITVFSHDIMNLYLRDPIAAIEVGNILSILSNFAYTAILAPVAYNFFVGAGKVSNLFIINAFSLVLAVPAIIFGTHYWNAIGAATAVTIINIIYTSALILYCEQINPACRSKYLLFIAVSAWMFSVGIAYLIQFSNLNTILMLIMSVIFSCFFIAIAIPEGIKFLKYFFNHMKNK